MCSCSPLGGTPPWRLRGSTARTASGSRATSSSTRLVARDTVEEKVLDLQKSKRALADAILLEDRSFLRDLTREVLALLLS